LNESDDEGVISYLSEKYNVVKHDTCFKDAIESIQGGLISSEIILASEYAEREGKTLIDAIKELRENISEATRILLILGAKRKSEAPLIEKLQELDIDYYAVDTYSASELRLWIETAKSKLPYLVWIADESEEEISRIESIIPGFVFKNFKVTNHFKDQKSLIRALDNNYPDTIALGYVQGEYDTERLVEEIKKATDNKVHVVAILDEANKPYEKTLRKKGAEVHYIEKPQEKEDEVVPMQEKQEETDDKTTKNTENIGTDIQKDSGKAKEDQQEEDKINVKLEKNMEIKEDIESKEALIKQNVVKSTEKIVIREQYQYKDKDTNKSISNKVIGTIVVAFGGADRGVGTTHAAYAFSSFLSRQGYKTAYVEKAEDPVMYQYFREEKYPEIEGGYRANKNLDIYVKYINGVVNDENVYSRNYNFIVLDLGEIVMREKDKALKLPNFSLMQRANIPIIVGGGAKWQLTRAAEVALIGYENWKIYINFANLRNEKDIEKAFKEICDKEAYLAPFCPDPFLIYKEQDTQFSKLIEAAIDIKIDQENQKSILSKLKFFQK